MHLAHVARHSHDGINHVIDTGISRMHLAGRDSTITALL
jgi:hypothetical protein